MDKPIEPEVTKFIGGEIPLSLWEELDRITKTEGIMKTFALKQALTKWITERTAQ